MLKNKKFEEFLYLDDEKKYQVIIGNDVWIGADVIILEEVTIGDGAIIAVVAIVNKDVPAYSIVGGVPAKIIRRRFNSQQIKKLLMLEWWNKDENWIKENADLFENIRNF